MMLRPIIDHKFSSPVWRMEIDSITDTLFTEIRDATNKTVHFSSVSLKNGQLYFDNLQSEERWLTGIEAAYDGVLLLHNYQSEAGPAHKGLAALDAFTGKTIWSNYNMAFDHLTINGPLMFDTRFQPPKLFLSDIQAGTVIRNYEHLVDLDLTNYLEFPQNESSEIALSLHLPDHCAENTIHYLEYNNLRIVSLHSISAGVLQQYLYIVNGEEVIYQDLLNTDIQKLQPESFMMYKSKLIYLKNQSQLKVLDL
jgi:hypothetical protein